MKAIKVVAIKSLKNAAHNPQSRLVKGVKALAKSIADDGLYYPLLVTENNVIVDGHRRRAALEMLGESEVPCIVVSGDASSAYAEVNTQARKHSGNETLQVYLKNPEAVGASARAWLAEAEEVIGRPLLQRMSDEGLSYSTFRLARRVAVGADREDPEIIKTLVKWMLHYGNCGTVMKAIDSGTPHGLIIAAAKRNKPIKVKFDVAR